MNRYDDIQKLDRNRGPYEEDAAACMTFGICVVLGLVVVLFACAFGLYRTINAPATRDIDCRTCHGQKAALMTYFRMVGSPAPEQMAEAVMATRDPRLMAAIAKHESGGNPHVRRAGYRRQHDGAFQVNPRYHGRVSRDAVEQALQAEAILVELAVQTGDIRKALNQYGGDSTRKKYARNILAELERVP